MSERKSGELEVQGQPTKKILNSWKEIAAYLNHGIRTVQRWERELGLPVRRPRGKRRSAVIAIAAELDAWVVRNRYSKEESKDNQSDVNLAAQSNS